MGLASTLNEAEAGVTLSVNAKGGVGHLLSFQAQYDALESRPTAYLAGVLSASLNGGTAFDAYCVDLYHVIYVGGTPFSFAVTPRPIAQLSAPAAHGAGVGYLYRTDAPLVVNDIDAAGLQVAIWKTEYDNGGSLTSGHFTVQDSSDLGSDQHLIFAKATSDLAAYDGTQAGTATWLEATTHPFDGRYDLNQNLVGPDSIPVSINFVVLTPEPTTMSAAIVGVGLILGLTWRHQLGEQSRKAGLN